MDRAAGIEGSAETRLATYGTLAPGRPNHHQLAGLTGRWLRGAIRGRLVEAGWGAALGFPGLVLDEGGPAVEVQLFESPDLPGHWGRQDAFEGPGYRRVAASVHTDEGALDASVYVVAEAEPHPCGHVQDDIVNDFRGSVFGCRVTPATRRETEIVSSETADGASETLSAKVLSRGEAVAASRNSAGRVTSPWRP